MMSDEVRWISGNRGLAEALSRVGNGPLAIDTEADSLHHYQEKVCLIQLSFGGQDYLFDPLEGQAPEALGPVLEDPAVPKLLHGADYDLRILDRDFGFAIRGIFDTMIAARLTGERAFGLAALLDKHLGVTLDKRFQRADWSRRPLSDEMIRYAVMDTHYLDQLVSLLEEKLRELGRIEWAREEFQQLEQVRWKGGKEGEPFMRVKGARRLRREGLAALRELWTLRDLRARERDVPVFKIMRDPVLVELARMRPRRRGQLQEVEGLPRNWLRPSSADAILSAIETAADADLSALPSFDRKPRPVRAEGFDGRVKQLMKARDAVADELELDPTLLANRETMETIQGRLDDGKAPLELEDLRRWQADLLEPLVRSS